MKWYLWNVYMTSGRQGPIHGIGRTRTSWASVFSPRAYRVVISVVYSASHQRYDDLTHSGSSKVLDHNLVYCAAYVRVNEELLAVKIECVDKQKKSLQN